MVGLLGLERDALCRRGGGELLVRRWGCRVERLLLQRILEGYSGVGVGVEG